MLRITLAYPRRDGRSDDPFLQRKWGGWDEGLSAQEVYDAGRGWWKVGARAKEERYAALTALGIVRQVIEITEWKYSAAADRSAFRGNILGPGDEMYDRYIGKELPATSRNPIGYVDEGPEPCKCGCGELTRNTWRPGHDQRAIHDRIRQDFGGDVAAFIDWYDNQRVS
jgi:hypothetical protein